MSVLMLSPYFHTFPETMLAIGVPLTEILVGR